LSAPDILFKGIPRGFTRGYTANTLAKVKPDQVVIPCCGSFALAEAALQAGVPAANIFCGDISLYSTALGNAITKKDWRLDLVDAAKEKWDFVLDYLTDPVGKAAAVMFMIRVLQYDKVHPTIYHLQLQNELIQNSELYVGQLREQITGMCERMAGLQYDAKDMWLSMPEPAKNKKAVLLVNPPRYNGGYDRMFKGIDGIFSWDEPEAQMFREADYARLMDGLAKAKALVYMYYATQGEDPAPMWGDPWRSVFADRPGNKRIAAINWIIANRSPIPHVMTRAKIQAENKLYKLFDGIVTDQTAVRAMTVDKPTGDFYRDLFIHKLPGYVTEKYVGLFMDGSLFGVVGLHMQDLRAGSKKKGTFRRGSITFAFTVPHDKYSRLHKLTLMSIISSWFWKDVMGGEKGFEVYASPLTVHTTMLTPHPENKTARGVMNLLSREKQKNGTYKLAYGASIIDRTREDTIAQWLKQFNK
jgi:hypothetical protein